MDKIIEKNERREIRDVKRRDICRGEVVKVLDGVHREPAEGVRIRVAMVETVHILVERADVDEFVGEMEMYVSPDWDEDDAGNVFDQKGRFLQDLVI
mmetsp:Transcript_2486/g.3636  ORF Transcript_2486/g.3636 Transcript_2486/m.3636 type:complete len:97 (+) Transcript_2486:649-939(+)